VVASGVTDSDRTTRERIADRLRCDERVFGLDEPRVAAEVPGEHEVVRNCAGPSVNTCRPVVEGCHQAGPHSLDTTGEIDVFEAIHATGERAREREVVLMPGVASTGCRRTASRPTSPARSRIPLGWNTASTHPRKSRRARSDRRAAKPPRAAGCAATVGWSEYRSPAGRGR